MADLVWSPVHTVIEDRLRTNDDLCLLIVSFIKIDALKQLLWSAGKCANLKVIVRWRIADIVNGASDLEIYSFLKERGVSLYFNEKIHLKLYIFESNVAFNTSGNLTLRGLGYSATGNVEVGSMVELNGADWHAIYELIEQSRQVDEKVFEEMKKVLAAAPKPTPFTQPLSWPPFPRKAFTIQAFPATEDPTSFIDYYLSTDRESYPPDAKQRAIHDLVALKLPQNLGRIDATEHSLQIFRSIPFVSSFVEELRLRGSMSFGSVSSWVHDKCEDVPVPYRWEIKDSVRRLYNWLAIAFENISWDRPNYSQVIYWKP